jgi:hypothetical protein
MAAPRTPTQPARYTPRAHTTAFASVVAKVTKPPTINRGIMRCFITVLLRFRLAVGRRTGPTFNKVRACFSERRAVLDRAA